MQLGPDNIAAYAETLVRQVRPGGYELDYSPSSLATVEALLRLSDARFQEPDFSEEQRRLVTFYNGCYVGEVLARTGGGVWRFAPNWFDASLVFPLGDGGLQVFPFQKVYRRVREGPEHDLVRYADGLRQTLEASPSDAPSGA